jgi:hypothetical protein
LLRHRSARHKTRAFKSEQIGDFAFKRIYQIARAVNVRRKIVFTTPIRDKREFFARFLQRMSVNEFFAR